MNPGLDDTLGTKSRLLILSTKLLILSPAVGLIVLQGWRGLEAGVCERVGLEVFVVALLMSRETVNCLVKKWRQGGQFYMACK